MEIDRIHAIINESLFVFIPTINKIGNDIIKKNRLCIFLKLKKSIIKNGIGRIKKANWLGVRA